MLLPMFHCHAHAVKPDRDYEAQTFFRRYQLNYKDVCTTANTLQDYLSIWRLENEQQLSVWKEISANEEEYLDEYKHATKVVINVKEAMESARQQKIIEETFPEIWKDIMAENNENNNNNGGGAGGVAINNEEDDQIGMNELNENNNISIANQQPSLQSSLNSKSDLLPRNIILLPRPSDDESPKCQLDQQSTPEQEDYSMKQQEDSIKTNEEEEDIFTSCRNLTKSKGKMKKNNEKLLKKLK